MKFSRFRLLNGLVVLLVLALVFANFGVGTMQGGQREYKCEIDVKGGKSNCKGPVQVKQPQKPGRALVILRGYNCGSYKIKLRTSGVGNFWLDLGNSPSNNCYGGDGGHFSHDSELCFTNTRLRIYQNDYVHNQCPECYHPVDINNFVNPSGVVTIAVSDGSVSITGAGKNRVGIPASTENCRIFACGTGPDQEHGTNDTTYYLGLNTVVDGSRTGSGVLSATISFLPSYGSCCCGDC